MLENLSKKIASKVDPIGWAPAVASVAGRAIKNPQALAAASTIYAARIARIPGAAVRVYTAEQSNPPLPEGLLDKRFTDCAWRENPAFFALNQGYFATRGLVDDVTAAGTGNPLQDAKARQFVNLVLDAVAPTNFAPANPGVITRAFDTGGASLVRGARYAVHDLVKRKGQPVKVDRAAFTVGENLAATPGKVVFRNELIEVIQYVPQTATVHAIPILAAPPWINKYYILDLAPGRSLIEWAVKHGRTVFVVSYRNPDESMMDIEMDDYFTTGFASAMDVVEEITGSEKVEVLSICLGGAMAAMSAARFAATGDTRISALTMLNTLLDYSEVGELGSMVDPDTLDRIEYRMNKQGFLSGAEMADTFDVIKAKDLIFSYWVSRWMKGEKPPVFDILAWNEDNTRMPAKMHSQYLRSLYGRDELARGEYVLAGRKLDLGAVTCDAYIVGAANDHIVPWESSYKSVHLLGGNVRFVLTNGGHIAGAVNPPNPKSSFWSVNAPDSADTSRLPEDPAEWKELADKNSGSWWEDWALWSAHRGGDQVEPPSMGSDKNPVLCDGPGTYVLG